MMLGIAALLFLSVAKLTGSFWTKAVFSRTTLASLSDFGLLLLAWAGCIVWHESGHLAAAMAQNFEVMGGSAGPVRFARENGHWTVMFRARAFFSASVSAFPRTTSGWRRRMLVVIAAGPVFTLAGTILPMLLLAGSQPPDAIARLLAFTAELNGVIFLVGLIPNSPGAPARNDCAMFLSLWFNAPDAHEIFVYHLLMQIRQQGARPRSYPISVVQAMATARARPEMRAVFAHTIADWAYDRGDEDSADAWDWRAIEVSILCEAAHYQRVLAHSACLDLVLRSDASAAQSKSADLTPALLAPVWFRHRSTAVKRVAHQDPAGALDELARAESLFPAHVPYFDFERDICCALRRSSAPRNLRVDPSV